MINGIAERRVRCCADALHRREPAHEGIPSVPRYLQKGLLGRFAPAGTLPGVLAVRPEMPTDVNVSIDPAGHHGEPSQVVHTAGGMGIQPNDLAVFNNDRGIVQNVAFAIEQRADAQHGRLALRRSHAGRSHYASQMQKNTSHMIFPLAIRS